MRYATPVLFVRLLVQCLTFCIQRTLSGFLLLLLLFCNASIFGQVRLPQLISDSMVLQRNRPIAIWGWAAPQEEIIVRFNNKQYKTKANADKKWSLTLAAMKAGGPYTMEIKASNAITLKGILIGDVWLCSGQSNMNMTMEHIKDRYAAEIAGSGNSYIRQFSISPKKYSFTPLDNAQGQWVAADPQTVLNFTAAGYFFARSLYEKYKVPVGLIHSSWGGTPIQAWISEEGLHNFPGYIAIADSYKDTQLVQSVLQRNKDSSDHWFLQARLQDKGLAPGAATWVSAPVDDSWKRIKVPGYWDDQGAAGVHGVVWFKKVIRLSATETGKDAWLELGTIGDIDTTYFNGVQVGAGQSSYTARKYRVPASLIRPGNNVITVRIISKTGKGGFVPGKTYRFLAAGAVIDLSGEWQYKVGAPLP
ncbi:MAG: sialate O-acetylesterase, partial [Niabella sp.]